MKNLLNYKVLYVLVIGIFLLHACCSECDDPTNIACPNYDPCHDTAVPSESIAAFGAGNVAKFNSSSSFNYFSPDTLIYMGGDTITPHCIFFSLNHEADSIFWQIGQDPRQFTGKQVFLKFDPQHYGQQIKVQYTLVKKSSCYPNGVYRETKTKSFTIASAVPTKVYFNSTYRGVLSESPQDTIEIGLSYNTQRITDFPKKGFNVRGMMSRSYDEFCYATNIQNSVWLAHGKFQKENRRHLIIDYLVSHDLGKTASWHRFEGYRID